MKNHDGGLGGGAAARLDPWLRSSPKLMCFATLDGWLIDVNPPWTTTLGWSEAELCGRPYVEFVHPDDRAETIAAGGQLQSGCAVSRFVNRYRRKDGGYATLEWNSSMGPAPGVVFAAVADVTAAHRIARLGEAVEQASGTGSWEYDPDTRAVYWSPMLFRIHDMAPTDPQPGVEEVFAYYVPESRETLGRVVERSIATGEPYDLRLQIVTARGRHIWVHATGCVERRDGKTRRIFGSLRDITLERTQRLRLDRLLAVAQHSTNVVVLTDPEGGVEWVNAACERLTGLSLPDLSGDAAPRRDIAALLTTDAPREEVKVQAPDGATRWLQVEQIGDGQGRIVIGAEVTELKEKEARLKAAEAEARAAVEGLQAALGVLEDGFSLYDADDRLVVCNDGYRELYRESAPAIRPGARFVDILRYGLAHGQYPEAQGREADWLDQRMAEHREVGREVLQALPGDRWLRIRERPTPSGGKAGLRIDITESVRVQRRLEAILDGTGAGVWEWDIPQRRVSFDAQWAAGRDPALPTISEWRVIDWLRRIHREDLPKIRKAMTAHLLGETSHYECQVRVRQSDGGWRWRLDRGRVCGRDGSGRALRVAGVHLDLTQIKSVEEALAVALHKAEDANEAKSRFLANMSHEIRTPLTSVIGFTRLLAEQPELSELSRGFIRRAASGCDALLATVNDVLDFSKLEAGEIKPAPTPTDVGALLDNAVDLLAQRAADKGLALRIEGRDALPPMLMVDPDRLRQIVLNLLVNAVKFTEAGEVVLGAAWAPEPATLRLSVRDTGPGIDAQALGRLFRRFNQSDDTITRRHGGTGLGLAICKGLSEAMGGDIGCDSTPGVGSTFHVTLPAHEVVAVLPADDRAPAVTAPVSLAGVRVLVGEDNEILREFIVTAISRVGGQVKAVEDGEDVLRLAARIPFDVIVLDHRMKRMDGAEAAARLRSSPGPNRCATLVLVSADLEAVGRAAMRDFDAAVAKPLKASDLASTIAEAMFVAPR